MFVTILVRGQSTGNGTRAGWGLPRKYCRHYPRAIRMPHFGQ